MAASDLCRRMSISSFAFWRAAHLCLAWAINYCCKMFKCPASSIAEYKGRHFSTCKERPCLPSRKYHKPNFCKDICAAIYASRFWWDCKLHFQDDNVSSHRIAPVQQLKEQLLHGCPSRSLLTRNKSDWACLECHEEKGQQNEFHHKFQSCDEHESILMLGNMQFAQDL